MKKGGGARVSRFVAIAVGLIVAIGIVGTYLYTNRTEAVVLRVSISAPNGGVFIDSNTCNPRENYVPLLDALTLSASADSRSVPIPETEWRLTGDKTCLREALVSLSPNQTYKVQLGSTSLGSIDAASFLTRSADFLHVISVTQDLHGTFELNQTADSCRESTTGWYCSWYPKWQVSLDLFRKTGGCKGNGGFIDIKNRTRVNIYSSDDRLLSSTELGNAEYDLKSVKSRVITCQFSWVGNDVPNDDKGYYLEVAKRGKVFFSTSDLQANGWALDAGLGD
jgi:hypothetical protein